MNITALGHSCVLLAFEDAETGEATRILVDPWLSDHAVGDAMGRFPRLRFDTADLGPIHVVYLSHAHCDHLDPYTLVRLWRGLETPPVLLLPVSLAFLVPIFEAHLPAAEIFLLEPHEPVEYRGLGLLGLFDVGSEATNEDDVMVLVVTHGAERVLVEADARLSLELPRFRGFLSMLMREPHLDSAVWLTTENELTGTMMGRLCTTPEQRAELLEVCQQELLQAVHQLYLPADDPDDVWQGRSVLRLVHGQGLGAAPELDPRWQRLLFPVRVEDRVRVERTVAAEMGCLHRIDGLTVGSTHRVQGGQVVDVTPEPWLELLDDEADRTFDPSLDFAPALRWAPLRSDPRDADAQAARILAALNQRFLPHLHGLRRPPVLHLLSDHGGQYRVQVHFGSALGGETRDYVLGFGGRDFVEQEPDGSEPQEAYWANDLVDLLDGRCDEFSTFCRQQFPVASMRFWESLATPLLNSDLVASRVRLHFERAQAGLSPGAWVRELL